MSTILHKGCDIVASIKVKVNISQDLRDRLRDINSPATMYAIHNTLAKRCDPYVPYLNGPLSTTFNVTSQGVTYTQPYARRQYFGDDFRHTLDFHPLASARWDEAMLRDHGDEFDQEVELILRRRLMRYGRFHSR